MKKYHQLNQTKLRDIESVSEAWMALVASGLTDSQINTVDSGGSTPEIERTTKAITTVFMATLEWALVYMAKPAGETNDPEKAKAEVFKRLSMLMDAKSNLEQAFKSQTTRH